MIKPHQPKELGIKKEGLVRIFLFSVDPENIRFLDVMSCHVLEQSSENEVQWFTKHPAYSTLQSFSISWLRHVSWSSSRCHMLFHASMQDWKIKLKPIGKNIHAQWRENSHFCHSHGMAERHLLSIFVNAKEKTSSVFVYVLYVEFVRKSSINTLARWPEFL